MTNHFNELDPIGNALLHKMYSKYRAGMIEHGGGLSSKPDDLKIWLVELQNEALDTAAYCEKMLRSLDN